MRKTTHTAHNDLHAADNAHATGGAHPPTQTQLRQHTRKAMSNDTSAKHHRANKTPDMTQQTQTSQPKQARA